MGKRGKSGKRRKNREKEGKYGKIETGKKEYKGKGYFTFPFMTRGWLPR